MRQFSFVKVMLVFLTPFLLGGTCQRPTDPLNDGTIQLFYKVNVDGAASIGLSGLSSVEVITSRIAAKLHADTSFGPEYVLDAIGGTTILPAQTQLITGNSYACPPGQVTQLRFYPTSIKLNFNDGTSLPVRLPSADQTGWKVVVDDSVYPNGYQIKSYEVTGIVLFMTLAELFHHADDQGWMAYPTIKSAEYNIIDQTGFEPGVINVVFNSTTSQTDINSIISGGNFQIIFQYPKSSRKIYKLRLSPNSDLNTAHSYLRGFASVVAAAPSVHIRNNQLTPNEGTPPALAILGAEQGWAAVKNLIGSVGIPNIVIAEVSIEGVNIEHNDLWQNTWINQGEILPICPLATGDVDGDGFITFKDFNDPRFPAAFRPPDVNGDGRITPIDLLAAGSPYVNGIDDDGNGFPDDLCGWNFVDNNRFPGGTGDHDAGVSGIMDAVGNNGLNTAGVCWNCRLMPIRVGDKSDAAFWGFVYACDNGAHVANFSAAATLIPSNISPTCPDMVQVDKTGYATVVSEMNSLITSTFNNIAIPTPLYVLSAGNCGVDLTNVNLYVWPQKAFAADPSSAATALVVAATANTNVSVGGLANYSNFSSAAQIAAPGNWANMLNGASNTTNNYSGEGTSFAAPTVSGIAGLVASCNLAAYAIPNGDALKTDLLNNHTIAGTIPGLPVVTMANLP